MGKVKILGNMKRGDTGPRVKGLQAMLAGYGYTPGPADGIFGSKTEAAVRACQKRQDIAVDGIVGPQTWGRLTKQTVGHIVTKASSLPVFTGLASSRTVSVWTIDGVKKFRVWAQGKSSSEYIRGSGCALSSALAAASAFRNVPSPAEFHKDLEKEITGRSDRTSGTPLAPAGAVEVLGHYGLEAVWKPYRISRSDIHRHLAGGKPALLWLIDKTGRYTSYLHTVLLAGVTDDGRWIMLDSGGRKLDGRYTVKLVDPADIYRYLKFCAPGKADRSLYWKGESTTTGIVLVCP